MWYDETMTKVALMEPLSQELLDSLKGSDVELDVTTTSGQRHLNRRLNNVTLKKTGRGDYVITGFCPLAQAVRAFSMAKVERIVVAMPEETV